MRKLGVVGVAVFLAAGFSSSLEAQGMLEFGLSGGASYTTLTGEYIQEAKYKWGFSAGALISERQANWFATLEVNYIQKGGPATTVDEELIDLSLNYLELPFILGIGFPGMPASDFGIYGGISFAMRLGCNISSGDSPRVNCADTEEWQSKSTEWTVPLGGALGFNLGGARVMLDGRYLIGLSKLFDGKDVKNKGWVFLLHVTFPAMRM